MDKKEALEILGLSPEASEEDITKAYRQLSKKIHPDVGGTSYLFRIVHDAYDFLTQTPPAQQEKQRTHKAQQAKKPMTFRELVTDPDFRLTFGQYLEAMETGSVLVRFKGYRINVSRDDIVFMQLPCKDSVDIHIRHYKNFFRFLFHKHDSTADVKTSTWQKYNDRRFSVTARLRMPTSGWYRIQLSKNGEKTGLYYHGRKNYFGKVHKTALTYWVDDREFKIDIWLSMSTK